jgi:hypothetical protein
MADAMVPFRQHVKKEAADELGDVGYSRNSLKADDRRMTLCATMYGPAARCKTDFQERRT